MQGKFTSYFKSPIGTIKLTADEKAIVSLSFVSGEESEIEKARTNKIITECKKQLKEYFAGKRKKFDVPLKLDGTEFQKKVWKQLLKVPFGKTASYGEIARKIKNPKAVRAVGGANNKNKI
ncbi:MAG: methylated-DNA--[protein]-cysteine S-methyltransferase, partial [Chlorobi bacterium]|nr:methylated-DNA--[protein]-cysteine S-methyltransferase [Chlorobiota bacterium]